jgi:putative chitinase
LEKNMLNEHQFLKMIPNAGLIAGVFVSALNAAMSRYAINTPPRMAAFIAQAGHESAQFTRMVENLNYSAQGLASTWPGRFAIDRAATPPQPNALALSLARMPEAIANAVYGGRMGNTLPGDGWRYRGRGLLQNTGKDNYRLCGAAIGLPLIDEPDLLLEPGPAAMAAGWFWSANRLNALADTGNIGDIGSIINTGRRGNVPAGADERKALYQRALKVLV